MKYELLKRTAIALFVGGVISSYTLAAEQPATSPNNKLTDSFNNIEAAINKNDKNIKNITKLLVGDKNDEANPGLISTIDTINKQATDNANLLIKMAGKVDQNKKDTDAEIAKKADQSAVDAELAKKANQADVDANKAEIEKIKNLEGYDSLSKVEALVSDKTNQVKSEIAKLEENQDEYNEGFRNELDAANETLDEHEAAIAKKANQADVDANKAEIAKKANQADVDANKAEIAKKADKTELATKANKTELATKADKNSVYSKSETDNKFALKADNSVVSAQAADIKNLRTDVNAHKVDIDKLRTDVNAHTKRLDHLDNRVNKLDKDLKRGLAAQAALTGLFQPYTVGKANFTAAVGGYKSQTAVAIGTGYRYNQNIATKAGVAFTQGGGVTYNAGVNFEW